MKKWVIITLIVAVLIFLIVGGVLAVKFIFSSKNETVEEVPTPTVALPTISENIKVSLTAKDGNKAVTLRISGLTSDIQSVEYELTYTTAAGLPRGVLGKISTEGAKEIVRDDIVLGTCSSGKCVYDTGVTAIDLSLKFNTTQGTSSVFRQTYPL